jgi:transcriptional regulator with XRE-family HTH domain
MPESFGLRLRERREELGIALITIARQTKIKQSLLEALERDDVSQWPSGIYRRAFIRAYARAIDLDPNLVVREFLEVHPEPPEVDVLEAMAAALDGPNGNSRPAARLRNVVGSAIGSLSRRRRGTPLDALVVTQGPLNSLPIPPDRPVADALLRAAPPVEPEPTREAIECLPANPPPAADLQAVARLCTEFSRLGSTMTVQPLLREAARILDATGLIVWLWDAPTGRLKPALVHGYSDEMVARLPSVRRDAENATAAAFRSGEICAIGGNHAKGALVVPLLTPAGCVGALAIELERGGEQAESVRAVATILAALLAQLTGSLGTAEVPPHTFAVSPRWATSHL